MKLDQDRLTDADVGELIAACGASSTGRRNAALVVLASDAGLRIGEIRDLRCKDVNLDTGRVTVQRGKGQKRRVTALSGAGRVVVRSWIERRADLGIPGGWVVCTLRGDQIPASYGRELLPRLARRAGIDKRVHPHALRHYAACSWHDAGAPIGHISTLLGHASVATTAVYLRRLGADQAVEWAAAR